MSRKNLKIILRDDDVFETKNWRTTLTWIVNLTIEKNMKLTMAVVPKWIQNNVEAVEYLNQLDKGYFEFATHGYYHSDFRGVPYEEQFVLIENGTKIMEECLPSRPYTFIPPFGRLDIFEDQVDKLKMKPFKDTYFGFFYQDLLLNLLMDKNRKNFHTLTPMRITFLMINNQNWFSFGLGEFLLSELGTELTK